MRTNATSSIALVACVAITLTACPGKGKKGAPAAGETAAVVTKDAKAEDAQAVPVAAPPAPAEMLGRTGLDEIKEWSSAVMNKKGLSALKARRWDEAVLLLEGADTEHAPSMYNLACALSRLERFDESGAALERALRAGYPQFGPGVDTDADLEGLRDSESWTGVSGRIGGIRKSWASALGEPGLFVLVGGKRALEDRSGEVWMDGSYERGQVWFFHLGTRRFLPLGLGASVAGFLLDRASRKFHFVSWNRQNPSADVVSPAFLGASAGTLDLASLESESWKMTDGCAGLALGLAAGSLEVACGVPGEAEASETWVISAPVGNKLKPLRTRDAYQAYDASLEDSKGAVEKACRKRVESLGFVQPFLLVDTSCDAVHPEAKTPDAGAAALAHGCVAAGGATFCLEHDGGGSLDHLFLVDASGVRTEILTTTEVMQIAAQ